MTFVIYNTPFTRTYTVQNVTITLCWSCMLFGLVSTGYNISALKIILEIYFLEIGLCCVTLFLLILVQLHCIDVKDSLLVLSMFTGGNFLLETHFRKSSITVYLKCLPKLFNRVCKGFLFSAFYLKPFIT